MERFRRSWTPSRGAELFRSKLSDWASTQASDLNPVAVLINRALIELPRRFLNTEPVFPGLAESEIRDWRGSQGIAADVGAYGDWLRAEAERRVGHMYPPATFPDGTTATAIAWIWARTVTCPNPACRIDVPLLRSWWLGRKKGREAYLQPVIVTDDSHPAGQSLRFDVKPGRVGAPAEGTMSGRQGARCVACDAAVPKDHIKAEGVAGRMGSVLMAVVAEKDRQRHYLAATEEHRMAALVERPEDVPDQELGVDPRNIWTPQYGLTRFSDLFTNRQLQTLTTFSDLVVDVRDQVIKDGGTPEYADAVAIYIGFAVNKALARNNTMCSWESGMDRLRGSFQRQGIPMTWDYAEANPLSSAGGGLIAVLQSEVEVVEQLTGNAPATVRQADAATRDYADVVISTDPPYCDNIAYSDLFDFFYVWLPRSLRDIQPDLLSTMLVPKAEELVANPYRHGGKDAARAFFEDGFRDVFARAREGASPDTPITVWYAFKQSESSDAGEASTGWETLLEGMIQSGWEITSRWPSRSEMSSRIASGTNALASSIVLSLRPRPVESPTTDRRGFIAALEAELPDALRKLQPGQIAPVDLPQAAIGPGMAVFSRYSAVLEPDGRQMGVRAALARINEILDQVLNEQEGDFDATSRFAIAWYRQHGYGVGKFGDADNLARARNTSVDTMDRDEILISRAGNVQLIKPADLSWDYDVLKNLHTSNWEALHHLIKVLERDGIAPAGDFLHPALARPDGAVDADLVKELAHLLFRIAEGNGWTKDALSFNNLVTSWPEILEVARSVKKATAQQGAFDFDEED